nr:DUF1919 domain-containing protein [Ligilactobacillus ruminis]
MKISKYYRSFLRRRLNTENRKRLKNKNFTVICNNCVGGVIIHELGERFNSPTVNLFFKAEDYLKFLENLDYYLKQTIVEVKSEKEYPVAKLDDIIIYFMHYSSFNEAKTTWEKRVARINKNNLYVIFVQQNDCTEQILEKFDSLPYKHKLALTAKPMTQIKCSYCIPGTAQGNGEVMDLCKYKGKLTGKRWIDEYDYVGFLNKK